MASLLTPQLSQADVEWLAKEGPDLWEKDPEFFVQHMLGALPWETQVQIMLAVRDWRETAVFSCNAAGKSFIASLIALWFLYTYPQSIVLTTAPTFRQVKDVLWRYIRTAYDRMPLKYAKQANTTDLSFAPDWYAFGLSTNDPDKFVGYHSESGHILVLADESAGIAEQIFEVMDAVMSTGDARLLMIGNPTSSSGRFRNAAKSRTVKRIQIKAWNTPNFTANNLTCPEDLCAIFDPPPDWESDEPYPPPKLNLPIPQLLQPIAVHDMIHKFGVESPWFQSRVEAVFPDEGPDTLIPLSWIERAMTKKRRDGDFELTGLGGEKKFVEGIKRGTPAIGVDPARFGDDRTVNIYREGNNVRDIRVYRKEDTIQSTSRVQYNLKIHNMKSGRLCVDGGGGYGGGIVDNMRAWLDQTEQIEAGYRIQNVAEVMVSKPPTYDPDGLFVNLRAQLYWELRKLFETDNIALPDTSLGQELANELSQIKVKWLPGGKIQIEEKAELKKRLLRSPDLADALMISYASPTLGEFKQYDQEQTERTATPLPEDPFEPKSERELAGASPVAGLMDTDF